MASAELFDLAMDPLAFLPHDGAVILLNLRYMKCAIVVVWIWDVLLCLPEELAMLYQYRGTLPDTTYFLSRFSTLAFILSNALYTGKFAVFFTGAGMGRISRALLQSGQVYYLPARFRVTVGFTIASAAALLIPESLGGYGQILVPLACLVSNAMITRVYRYIKLGLLEPHGESFLDTSNWMHFGEMAVRVEDVDMDSTSEADRSSQMQMQPLDLV
ncbi:hypothetical protein EIP91_007856 [Steccherinum ochraceum]|uniref:Uncharacterized protein n=1 Tax=Steccherinum ochraceum TaxID=92696 RepID=A0A4V2MVC0_9APHY|nr:hypothetical protein EIP91_007856 [Steccherinum ochraceum]